MSELKQVKPTKLEEGRFHVFETFLNTLNHVFIGFITIYITWFIFNGNLTATPLHTWLCTIGFQLLAAEGIMMIYPMNSMISFMPHKWRKHFHWVLQLIGTIIGLAGIIVLYCHRQRTHFSSVHSILGLIGTLIMLVNFGSGLFIYFAKNLKGCIRPVTIKATHNFIGIFGLVLSLVSLYYGYEYLSRRMDASLVLILQILTILSIVLSLIGPLKSFFNQCRDVLSLN